MKHLEAAEALMLTAPNWAVLAHLAFVIDMMRRANGLDYRPADTSVHPDEAKDGPRSAFG